MGQQVSITYLGSTVQHQMEKTHENDTQGFRLPISAALSSTSHCPIHSCLIQVSITYLGSTVQHSRTNHGLLEKRGVSITYLGSTVQHRHNQNSDCTLLMFRLPISAALSSTTISGGMYAADGFDYLSRQHCPAPSPAEKPAAFRMFRLPISAALSSTHFGKLIQHCVDSFDYLSRQHCPAPKKAQGGLLRKGFDYLSRQHCPAHLLVALQHLRRRFRLPISAALSSTYGGTEQHAIRIVSITYLGSTVQHQNDDL